MDRFVSPLDTSARPRIAPAPRPESLDGITLGLIDISKPKGEQFLDRLAELLVERHALARIVRLRKPTYARPAPEGVLDEASRCGAIVEALAD